MRWKKYAGKTNLAFHIFFVTGKHKTTDVENYSLHPPNAKKLLQTAFCCSTLKSHTDTPKKEIRLMDLICLLILAVGVTTDNLMASFGIIATMLFVAVLSDF
jgi:hypothetical protein